MTIKWWIDASFAVHPDMRSHTGATISLGQGSPFSFSRKQRVNTKSSTEAELVGVDDGMPLILWTRHFLTNQGFKVKDNVVYQDNQSAILLEKNGKSSSGRRTRHLDIRYFFVTDRIKNGDLQIEYCPTGDMVADFFTKPLQGSLFRKLRGIILNLPNAGLTKESHQHRKKTDAMPPQECVGANMAARKSYADVVRGTDGKSSHMDGDIRQSKIVNSNT
jgi:hypothetical protein